jgi:hypothetical protein
MKLCISYGTQRSWIVNESTLFFFGKEPKALRLRDVGVANGLSLIWQRFSAFSAPEKKTFPRCGAASATGVIPTVHGIDLSREWQGWGRRAVPPKPPVIQYEEAFGEAVNK